MIEQDRSSFDRFLGDNSSNLGTAIHKLWESREPSAWSRDPYFYRSLGELADRLGQAMFAHDVLEEALVRFPADLRLKQLFCLALVKCGFLLRARDMLARLVREGEVDEETLGILGRVYKEMWLIAGDGDPQDPHLRQSRNLYLQAFRRSRGHYSGINAATLSRIMGDRARADTLARLVVNLCARRLKDPAGRDYWTVATVGEAFVLLGRQEQACRYFRLARSLGGGSYSNLASTRRQLNLLARYAEVDAEVLEVLRIPPVAAFTGHMLDAPGRRSPRFPAARAEPARRAIEAVLDKLGASIGYCSAACGGDVLFLEALQARGGETNVILPFAREEFFATSVSFAGESWERRSAAVMEKASVETANPGSYGGENLLFSFANRLILGKAIQRSRFLETEAHLVALWDGKRSRAVGGTSEVVQTWEATGRPLTVIDVTRPDSWANPAPRPGEQRSLSAGRGARGRRTGGASRSGRGAGRGLRPKPGVVARDIVAILFADLVGYSRLGEDQIPHYVRGFLGTAAERLERFRGRPVFKNIWGDAILFVFQDLVEAAEAALALRDMVRETDWAGLGLPEDLNIRIGLHAGPVYYAREPLLGRTNFFGFHVNQAARIEPITSAGNVYASEQFAALMLAHPGTHLECRYVGVILLPKDFGSYPIYHVKRENEIG